MSFEVRFGPESGITYDTIVTQLQNRWGEKVVLKFEAQVRKSVKAISSNPYIYAVVHDGMQLRKCVLHKSCSMLYKIYDNEVLVVTFWDNRQDPIF